LGDPKKQRRKYDTPRFPWRTSVLSDELKLLGQYGLRNKHELWRHETNLSKFRGISRSLTGKTSAESDKIGHDLLVKLKKKGVLHETAVIDDVLDLTIHDILERRLQTIIFRKGLARTIYQARQLITHGHIVVCNQIITEPGYLVAREEEKKVAYLATSSISNKNHPLQQSIIEQSEVET
jgi:small subunit ribosomal protein S4